jgi:hypothetical protein
MAMYPLSEAMKNPFEKGSRHDTCKMLSSELNAFSANYFNSLFSKK